MPFQCPLLKTMLISTLFAVQQHAKRPSFSTECSCRQEDETTAATGKHSPQQCARMGFFSTDCSWHGTLVSNIFWRFVLILHSTHLTSRTICQEKGYSFSGPSVLTCNHALWLCSLIKHNLFMMEWILQTTHIPGLQIINPQEITVHNFLNKFPINVWWGTTFNKLTGPNIFKDYLTLALLGRHVISFPPHSVLAPYA